MMPNNNQNRDEEIRARDDQDHSEELDERTTDNNAAKQSSVNQRQHEADDNGTHERDAEFTQKGSYQGQYNNPDAQQAGRESTIQAEQQGGDQAGNKYPNRDYKDDKNTSRQDFDTQGRYGQNNPQSNPQNRDLKQHQHEASTHQDVQKQQLSREPITYKNDDERIAHEVHSSLAQHSDVDANNIQVNVVNGEVILNGTVNNSRIKLMVENAASAISAVKYVQSNLRVQEANQVTNNEIRNGVTGQGQPAGQPGEPNNN